MIRGLLLGYQQNVTEEKDIRTVVDAGMRYGLDVVIVQNVLNFPEYMIKNPGTPLAKCFIFCKSKDLEEELICHLKWKTNGKGGILSSEEDVFSVIVAIKDALGEGNIEIRDKDFYKDSGRTVIPSILEQIRGENLSSQGW